MASKVTSKRVATESSTVLTSTSTGKASRTAAGSSLSLVSPSKVTSAKAATKSSKVLRDGRTGNAAKSSAGSALVQRPKK
jgi:hypothetical protein